MKPINQVSRQLRHLARPLRLGIRPVKRAARPLRHYVLAGMAILAAAGAFPGFTQAQTPTVLQGAELTRVVPTGFFFQGQSGPTQMRNSTAVRLGDKRYVVAGLVDTSGYSADVRARYEGFLITDSAITINGTALGVGAYGFGFTDDGKLNVLDLAGNEVLSVSTTKDSALRRPRPLLMVKADNGIRLYSGRDYAVIAAQ